MTRDYAKRTKRDLDDLAIKAARMAFEDGLKPSEIAVRLRNEGNDVHDARDAHRLLLRARDERLVRVRVERVSGEVPTDEALGERLAAVVGVRDVIVVTRAESSDNGYGSTDHNVRARAFVESDKLHDQLAKVAARHLWGSLRDGDSIAVGDGRATDSVAEALGEITRSEPRRFVGLSVYSLAGSGHVWAWAERGGAILDADNVTNKLATVLGVKATDIHLVRLPVALGDSQQDLILSAAPHLAGGVQPGGSADSWRPFDVAVFGLGVLNTGHHLLLYEGPWIDAISEEIKEVKRLNDELHERGLPTSAIAGICNQFFSICDSTFPIEIRQRVEDIVVRLNSKTVSVGLARLSRCRHRILVAGGLQKYPGLKAMLIGDATVLRPTVFVTDEITARSLLQDSLIAQNRSGATSPSGRNKRPH